MQETRVQSLGQEDSPREDQGNPLWYSCLENPMDWGAWRATVYSIAESDMAVRLHRHTYLYLHMLSSCVSFFMESSETTYKVHPFAKVTSLQPCPISASFVFPDLLCLPSVWNPHTWLWASKTQESRFSNFCILNGAHMASLPQTHAHNPFFGFLVLLPP